VDRLRRLSALFRAAAAALLVVIVEFFAAPWRRIGFALGLLAIALALKPPLEAVAPGEVGVRVNHLTGGMSMLHEGPALLVPFVHDLRRYSLRDQVYRPSRSAKATGEAPFQTVEGLSIGVQVTVRYALDPDRIGAIARRLPQDVGRDLIEPVVDGVLYRALSKYTVREVFTARRAELQKRLEDELRAALAGDGILVRAVFIANVDLPPQYREGLEAALAEELRADRMQHTLRLKRKEIQQRRLEAVARKVQRKKHAEGEADARGIEVAAEVAAQRKLADAEAYRLEVTGKAHSANLARDSALIAQNPLLIQKVLADKLSDKVQVIVAPPSDNGFIGSSLVGARK